MPRTGWRKSASDRRLPDLVSVGLLTKVFPAEVVDAVIAACGRTEQRRRSLPARSMASFAMGMALHSEGSYEDVLALISDGLAWAHRQEGSVSWRTRRRSLMPVTGWVLSRWRCCSSGSPSRWLPTHRPGAYLRSSHSSPSQGSTAATSPSTN